MSRSETPRRRGWASRRHPDNLLKHGQVSVALKMLGKEEKLCTNRLRIQKRVSVERNYSLSLPLSRKKSADLQFPSLDWTVEAAQALLPRYEPEYV